MPHHGGLVEPANLSWFVMKWCLHHVVANTKMSKLENVKYLRIWVLHEEDNLLWSLWEALSLMLIINWVLTFHVSMNFICFKFSIGINSFGCNLFAHIVILVQFKFYGLIKLLSEVYEIILVCCLSHLYKECINPSICSFLSVLTCILSYMSLLFQIWGYMKFKWINEKKLIRFRWNQNYVKHLNTKL